MFIQTRSNDELNTYKKLLRIIGSLSNLFAETNIPYISYRVSENLFCRVFSAKNLSRSDVSADASVQNIGIGIKTFIEDNGRTFQKVAEFNKDKKLYSGKSATNIIKEISHLRNARLDATKRIHDLNELLYHCVTRKDGLIMAYDTQMQNVNLSALSDIVEKNNIIHFNDGINEYSFNLSKSTLYKRFITPKTVLEVNVDIIKDPFATLEKLIVENNLSLEYTQANEREYIYLPLYSSKDMQVPVKSQLNQWNGNGRDRSFDEAYIHIPSWIHRKFPSFFPSRDTAFDIELPNGKVLNARVCQGGGKALMSNPNKDLGEWLLRDVLMLKEGELLTYDKLKTIGLDSVVIHKEINGKFTINFAHLGSFEKFKNDKSDN